MEWKFWGKKSDQTDRYSKPADLPSRLGKYLVVDLKLDPDWVWSLKIVTVTKPGKKHLPGFRIFDPAKTRAGGLDVKDYNSLDDHSHLICFDGWYNKDSWEMEVNSHYQS